MLFKYGYAQQPVSKNLNITNGLPSNVIYEIYQSKNGVVWIASDYGLIRNSGNTYQLFNAKNTASKGVSNIMEDEKGTIWCQNFSGQFLYLQAANLMVDTNLQAIGNFRTATIINGKNLCFSANNKIIVYNIQTHKTKQFTLSSNTFIPFMNDYSNKYCLFNNESDSIAILDSMERLSYFIDKKPSKTQSYFYATWFKNKPFFIAKSEPHLIHYQNKFAPNKLVPLLKNKLLNNSKLLSNGKIALLTSAGFYFIDEQLNASQVYLPTENVSSIILDDNNNLWVGTLSNGVHLIPSLQLLKYQPQSNYAKVAKAGNLLIAGTDKDNIDFLNIKTFAINASIKDPVPHSIKSIFKDPTKDEILYCNYNLNKYNLVTHQKSQYPISVNTVSKLDSTHYLLSESNCLSIFPVQKNDAWLSWLTDSTRSLSQNRLILNNNTSARSFEAIIYKDTIFASNAKGFFLFYKNGVLELKYNQKVITPLAILPSKKGLLVATSDAGILWYKNKNLQPFLYTNTLKDNEEIYSVKVFDDKIYVLLYSGLDVFDMNGKLLQHFVRSDGFFDIDISDFTVNDNLFIATCANGIVTFPLDNTIIKSAPPKLLLATIEVNQKPIEITNFITLNSKQRNIEITLDNLDYFNLVPNKLFYAINNNDWIPFKGNKISFNELAYGTYEIRFKAINERGVECITKPIVNFEIATPLHKTWWFISLMGALIIGLMFLAFRYRLQQINARNKLLTEKIDLERALHSSTLSGIKSQMNPHFLFNALNTIQSYIYLNDKKTASDYLVKFSELTRLILENSNKETIFLSEELKAIKLYLELEKMRFEENFNYVIDSDTIKPETIKIPSMLIQPYLENAIKHGLLHKEGAKLLQLKFQKINNELLIVIQDNGIGIEASKSINSQRNKGHQSFANLANKKRIELLNQLNNQSIGLETETLYNSKQQVEGTKVSIRIPI